MSQIDIDKIVAKLNLIIFMLLLIQVQVLMMAWTHD